MNKKKLLIIGIVIVIIVIIVILFNNNSDSNKNIVNDYTIDINKKIEVNDDYTEKGKKLIDDIKNLDGKTIVYITGNKNDGIYVDISQKLVDYYKDIYNLDYISFNINDYSRKDFVELLKVIGVAESNPPIPTLVLYSKESVSYIGNFFLESDLRNLLISNNYISQDDMNKDVIITKDTFKDGIVGDNKFIYLSNEDSEYYKYRKYMYNNYHNKITLYSSIFGMNNTFDIYKIIQEKLKKEFIEGNCLFLVDDNKVKDYLIDFKTEDEIDKFFEKNGIGKD